MNVITFRRTFSLVASAALVTSLAIGAYAAPATAKPSEQQVAAKQARAEARTAAKAARDEAKQARAEARAQAKADRKAARDAAKQARAEARAARKAAKQADLEKVAICHKPGTPAEGTLYLPGPAIEGHLAHGDVEGTCETPEAAPVTTCPELDAADIDGQDEVCEEPQEVLVTIEAPESIGSAESLTLQGAVSGLEGDDLTYGWSSTCLSDEQLTDPSIIASEPDSALLVIREDVLAPDTTCDFTLTVADEAAEAEGSATVSVEVVALT